MCVLFFGGLFVCVCVFGVLFKSSFYICVCACACVCVYNMQINYINNEHVLCAPLRNNSCDRTPRGSSQSTV